MGFADKRSCSRTKRSGLRGGFLALAIGLLGVSSLGLSSPALAGEGATEINQACAVGTGCFDGDSPGFPVTIPAAGKGGSFALTSDLRVPAAALGGISIAFEASDVTIDLNGFAMISDSCVGNTALCTRAAYSASRHGIYHVPSGSDVGIGTTVRNGRVIGFAGAGLRLGEQATVHEVEARFNSGQGIYVFDGSMVIESQAIANGFTGILHCCSTVGGSGGLILRSSSSGNTTDGIAALSSIVLADNVSQQNQRDGIVSFLSSVVVGNIAENNAVEGFDGSGISVYLRNVSRGNGSHGFSAEPSGSANYIGNVARENAGFGLLMASPSSAFRKNILTGNAGGTYSGGTDLGNNVCIGGGGTCP